MGLMPGANEQPAQESKSPEHDQAEQRRQPNGREQLLRLKPGTIVVDKPSNTWVSLPKEEVTDDRADHRQARGDAPALQTGGKRTWQLQLDQALPAGCVLQREQVMVRLVDRFQTEQRVGDDREH